MKLALFRRNRRIVDASVEVERMFDTDDERRAALRAIRALGMRCREAHAQPYEVVVTLDALADLCVAPNSGSLVTVGRRLGVRG